MLRMNDSIEAHPSRAGTMDHCVRMAFAEDMIGLPR